MKKPAKRKPKRRAAPPRSQPVHRPAPRKQRGQVAAALALSTHWFAQHPDRGAMVSLMVPVLFMAVAFGTLQTNRRMPVVFAPTYSETTRPPAIISQAPHREILPAPQEVAMAFAPVTSASMPNADVPAKSDELGITSDIEIDRHFAASPVDSEPEEMIVAGLPFADAHLPIDPVRVPAPDIASPVSSSEVAIAERPVVVDLDSDPGQLLAGASRTTTAEPVEDFDETPIELAALAHPPPRPDVPHPLDVTPDNPGAEPSDSTLAVCRPLANAEAQALAEPADPETFGTRLAAAALKQTEDVVIYTARYKRIAYPMGDLPPLHGACSDVVVRAYRALGIDLQQLVQRANLGRDPNIDHRRTQTLRRLFTRFGQSLTVSQYPEDYLPGDVVTYYRPFSRVSRAHIAIVSDVIAPSGRPMVIHNRGWGAQLEDALFSDQITGHYRFSGIARPVTAGAEIRLRHSELRRLE